MAGGVPGITGSGGSAAEPCTAVRYWNFSIPREMEKSIIEFASITNEEYAMRVFSNPYALILALQIWINKT